MPSRVTEAARGLLYGRGVPASTTARRLASSVLGLALLASSAAHGAPAAPPTPVPSAPAPGPSPTTLLLGVPPNSRVSAITELGARVGVDCRASSPVRTGSPPRESLPVVCAAAPVPAPMQLSATYWYEDDALARAFLVAAEPAPSMAVYRARFDMLNAWITRALGAPTVPLRLPAGWDRLGFANSGQMSELLSGAARLSITWQRPEASVELWLAGERGRVVLAVGMRRNAAAPRCDADAVAGALLDLFPPAPEDARARAAALLAACRVTRAAGALRATLDDDDAPAVQARALRALGDLGAPPERKELARLAREAPPVVADAAKEILSRPRAAPPVVAARPAPEPSVARPAPEPSVTRPAPEPSVARPAPPPSEAHAEAERPTFGPPAPAPVAAPAVAQALGPPLPRAPAPRAEHFATAPPPEARAPEPYVPPSGVPLAIGASTIAGATLFRNLGMTGGLSNVTPQLLLGSTGAVIGFGTSWGLSRFGFKPTVEQAAWYANTTAWGTLAGIGAWAASGYSDAPQLKYGLPVLGEVAGMGVGVWSAAKWSWTGPQIVLADSLLLGAGLGAFGAGYIRDPSSRLTLTDAIVAPVAMVGAAVASRALDPSERDVGLMMSSALAAGWTGSLLGAGLARSDFLASHQSWGGFATGVGLGYLGGAAAGAFTEVSPRQLGVGALGMATGNLLGLGLHLTIQGFARDDVPGAKFTSGEVNGRATSTAIGGVVLSAAAIAAQPHLHLGPSAPSMTLMGTLYGAGTWWLASLASYDGRPTSDVTDARLVGGLLTGATVGGLTGLVTSRWFAPEVEDHFTALLGAGLGMSAGLGIAKLTTDTKGTPDAVGVLLGTGVGLAGGAYAAHTLELRAPDVGAGFVGGAEGLFVGTLLPTIRWDTWQDSRATAGGTLLGLSLGAAGGIALAHATDATGGEVGVATTAGAVGLMAGAGLGWAQTCPLSPVAGIRSCTSQAPRVGALVGSLSLMGGAIALEPTLHLATTLGPDATKLGVLGGAFGFADGLLLAGALSPDGVISGTTSRQAWGGILFGTSVEASAGVVASKWVHLRDGDRWFLTGGKLTGGLFGLGAAMLARDHTGGTDTLATLAGSWGGLAAATAAQMYTPLDSTDGASAAIGAAYGSFLGALVPTLDEPTWQGLDHRKTGGGLLLGLSAGAIGGAAISHATDASARSLGLTTLGGADGLAAGLGLGLLASSDGSSRPTRIGLVAGTSAGLALGGLVWPRLTLGPDDGAMIAVGTTLGAWTGAWLPTLGHASFSDISARKPWGGFLAGAGLSSIGASLLAPVVEVDDDFLLDASASYAIFSAAGAGAGALVSKRDDAPVWGMLGVGTAGLLAGAGLHRSIAFDQTTAPYLAFATAEGAWLGGWLPSLTDNATDRQRTGALVLGGFGGLGAAYLSTAAVRPDGDLLADAALVDALWTGAGAGAGALVSTSDKAPVWGLLGAGVAGTVLGGALHRRIELTSADAPLLALAGGEGAWLGAWIPGLLDDPTGRQRVGALALGSFGGVGLATVASPFLHLDADFAVNAAGLNAVFAGAGLGAGALVSTSDKAPVWGLLGAGTAGFIAGGALHRQIELTAADAPLLTLAGGEGTWLGAWIPELFDGPTGRQRAGALALGAFGGVGLATVASPYLHLDADFAVNAAVLNGLFAGAGAGAGALVSTSDKAPVWGLLAAGTAGFIAGGALHRSIELAAADAPLLTLAGAEGTWMGAWIPELLDSPTGRQRVGALALGSFGGLGLATVASPFLHVDADVAENAAAMNGLFAGAGAGAGLLVSDGDKAPVWGLLGAGTAGLLAGGALHRSIEMDETDAPLVALSTGEGLWLGGWLPYALHARDDVSGRERAGALMLGGFGAAGLSTLASGAFTLAPDTAGWGAVGSAIGASMGGGIALLSTSLQNRGGVGLILGGTGLGLATGLGGAALLRDESGARLAAGVGVGAGLGVSEGLLFAWSGGASGGREYGGAALLGGGVGASLGLAAATAPFGEHGSAPATAGFAAWGAFSGALVGSLIGYDARNVTLGGVIGANAGFFAGYGLLHAQVVDPSDFGWLSLFGALGTVAGAGVTAPFSAGGSAPIRAGMAVGPPIGMVVGALVLPRLRRALGPRTAALELPQSTAQNGTEVETEPEAVGGVATSAPGPAGKHLELEKVSLSRKVSEVASISDWQPLVGALPASPDGGPAPVLFGVTGHWK